MAAISNDWLEYIQPEFGKEYYKELYTKVKEEYAPQGFFRIRVTSLMPFI